MRNDSNPSCHCERYFWEYNKDGLPINAVRAIYGNPITDALVGFRADLQSDGKIHLLYDTNNDGVWEVPPNNANGKGPVTPWTPATEWPGGQVPLFMEELTWEESNYKGTSLDPTNFSSLRMRNSSGTWIFTDLQTQSGFWDHYNTLPNKGFLDVLSDTFIRIWN